MFYNKKGKLNELNDSNNRSNGVDLDKSNNSLLFFHPLAWTSLCSDDNQNCNL